MKNWKALQESRNQEGFSGYRYSNKNNNRELAHFVLKEYYKMLTES